jgi:hypothetical protein
MAKSALTPPRRSNAPRANLYARLASIDPSNISEKEESRLAEQIVRPWARKQSANYKAAALAHFPEVHRQAWSWICGLLAGDPVKPGDRVGQVTWYLEGGAVQSSFPEAHEVLHGELIEIILQQPFPFRRCVACQAVFVRRGKSITCSAACRREWRRRGQDNPEYRARMRRYMKPYRGLREALEESGGKETDETRMWRAMLPKRGRHR